MSIVHYVLALRLPYNSGRYTTNNLRDSGVPSFRQLQSATEKLDKEQILKLLSKGVAANGSDCNGESVLHCVFRRPRNYSKPVQAKMISILQIYLDHGVRVDSKNAAGETALYLALKNHLDHVAGFLVSKGAKLDVADSRGNTALHFVIENEFTNFSKACTPTSRQKGIKVIKPEERFVDSILEKVKYVDYKNVSGDTPLSMAANRNLLHVVAYLMKYTKKPSYMDKKRRTIFHIFLESIAQFNNYELLDQGIPTFCYEKRYINEITELLLKKGFSFEVRDKNGNTPLHLALRNKRMDIVKIMMKHSLELPKIEGNELVDYDFSLLQLAVMKKCLRVVRYLKEDGVDFNVLYLKNNLLHLLSTNVSHTTDSISYETLVDLLINAGCDVNARNIEGKTPLHLASQSGILPVVKRLIEHGARVNSRELSERRFTPLHEAVDNNRGGIIEILVNAGADVNAKTANGQTSLHLAMQYDSDMTRTLLRLGAHADIQDDEGRVPFYDAINYHNIVALQRLLKYGVDINDHGVFREIRNLDEVEPVLSNLLEHWMKLQAADLPAADFYRYQVVDKSFQELYKECLDESVGLKNCLFDDGISMYELLHMKPNRRCEYMSRRNMKNSLLSPKLRNLFPNYHNLIKACYHESTARYSLLEPAKCAWYELTGIGLPRDCVDEILAHVDNMTLRSMVDGVKQCSFRDGSYNSC